MAAINVTFEVLTAFNYERWSVLMKNYLRGEDLWDIIDTDGIDPTHDENWRKRDAKALYAIQLSCGPDCFKMISEINDARDAWNRLRQFLSPESKAN